MSASTPLRARAAATRATALLTRNAELAAFMTALNSDVERNRLEMAQRRLDLHAARRSLTATMARQVVIEVTGTIDGLGVAATWTDGGVTGSPELIERAEMLVAMGERLTAGDRSDSAEIEDAVPKYTASLAGPPMVVALTLMRACTRVTSVDFPVAP
jgi:hypothetical protein